ncbi:MAG: hypothetical protein GY797_16045, partial [Deltaproteobacteria bacterium]|nr:hypothetical protein [Deltaproteobacteria bacterium]
DIARMILNYLRKNPNAGDTLEGISKWWLDFEKIDIKVDEVSKVLEALIKEGKVKMQVIEGDNPVYLVERKE